jgi:hypothetical protein
MNTQHASHRAQQRGIPPLIDQWLDLYGQEQHDGRGAIVMYFNKRSIRSMQRELGKRPVARMHEWLNAYKVKTTDGCTITIGHRTKRISRK